MLLLLEAQCRQALAGTLGVDAFNKTQPLDRMHPGKLGPERAVFRKQSADARCLPAPAINCERVRPYQLELHCALPWFDESRACQRLGLIFV